MHHKFYFKMHHFRFPFSTTVSCSYWLWNSVCALYMKHTVKQKNMFFFFHCFCCFFGFFVISFLTERVVLSLHTVPIFSLEVSWYLSSSLCAFFLSESALVVQEWINKYIHTNTKTHTYTPTNTTGMWIANMNSMTHIANTANSAENLWENYLNNFLDINKRRDWPILEDICFNHFEAFKPEVSCQCSLKTITFHCFVSHLLFFPRGILLSSHLKPEPLNSFFRSPSFPLSSSCDGKLSQISPAFCLWLLSDQSGIRLDYMETPLGRFISMN